MATTLNLITLASDIITMAAAVASLTDTALRYWNRHRKNA